MRLSRGAFIASLVVVFAASTVSFAQSGQRELPPGAAELSLGYAGFVDDVTISHALVGGAARWYLSPRIAIGPELVYMVGPGDDRDLVVTGNLTFDVRARTRLVRPAVIPYFVIGGGLFHHRNRIGPLPFSSTEGAVTGGGGVRIWFSPRTYAAGEVRLGWEPHIRYSGHIGIGF
jgi:hypothetical protein